MSLKAVLVGTEMHIVPQGLPDVMPLEACYLGWQESLPNLPRLVEPDIQDQQCPKAAPLLLIVTALSMARRGATALPTNPAKGLST